MSTQTLDTDRIEVLRELIKTQVTVEWHRDIDKLCDMAQMLDIMREQKQREEQAAADKRLADSWITDPDRMGGQFTEQELNDTHWL